MEWFLPKTHKKKKLLTLFKPSTHNPCNTVTDNNSIIEQSTIKIWIHLPFLGKYGTKLMNSFIWKISPLLISPCKFIVNWKTTDANCFISLKDHTPKMYQSSVVYEFKCPGCNANYVGKTDRCLYTRIKEHSCHDSSKIYNHICSCNDFNFIKNMLELSPYNEDSNIKCSLTDLIFTNTQIIDKSKHWSLILFQESIAVNRLKLSLNYRTKASKDLLIFN